MRISLKAKIWITVIAIVLMFTVFLLLYVPAQQEKFLLKDYNNEVQNLASTVALGVKIALTEQNFEGVQTAMDFVKDDPRLRFVSLVQLDTIRDEHQKTAQVKKMITSYPPDVKVSAEVESSDSLVVKRSLFHTPVMNGEILLGFSTTEITKSKEQIRATSLFVSALVLIIGIIIGFWLARNISLPVLALRDAALKVGAGDRLQRVRKTTNDEIGELGEAFNKMVADLFKAEEELKKVNSNLAATNSELKKALDELHSAQSQLVQSEKMASLGQLTAGVAHEINNPINFVSANVNPLKRNLNDLIEALKKSDYPINDDLNFTIEETRNLLKGIEEGSKRTAEIVKGLRNFSRLDEEEMKKANINEGIESTLILVQNKLDQQNIKVIKSLGKIPEIDCYPGQLNQVFMNLLTNAIDAVGKSGSIFITTSSENNGVKISIRDTGAGMSDDVKRKLFDPFFTTKEVGKGTGLGLSISYGIIEKHNGKIEVKSEVGKGTEFIISLPVTS